MVLMRQNDRLATPTQEIQEKNPEKWPNTAKYSQIRSELYSNTRWLCYHTRFGNTRWLCYHTRGLRVQWPKATARREGREALRASSKS